MSAWVAGKRQKKRRVCVREKVNDRAKGGLKDKGKKEDAGALMLVKEEKKMVKYCVM